MSVSYQKLYSLSALPEGKMKCVVHDGQRILLAHTGGTVYATDDTCTHEDASLATGSLKGDCVKCPLHGSRFNLQTGQALDEPAEGALKTYAVKIDGDDILVEL